ncbi:MAG: flagellar assembly protein FliW [Desulfosalsimonas sp.]|uniref:flagellar assembly protein FliW n=1 Tax=Desulfosalsimonas sp. TaxID=3073848 RepID=UPI0039706989
MSSQETTGKKTLQTRFGDVSYDPDKMIRFPEGLVGFEQLLDFVVLPNRGKDDPLFCFQSVEEPHLSFLLINPALFFPDYQIAPGPEELEKLAIKETDPYFVLTTITFHDDQSITLNLLAPVIYTPKTDRALQVILDGSGYKAKTPLPENQ